MDSVTQFVLGAAVSHATVGRRLGRKAILAGGILGTVPDLDVVIDFGDAIDNFTMHRGFSHSFLILIAATLPFAFGCSFFFKREKTIPVLPDLGVCVGLVFITHILLDALTVYGTQLFWPTRLEPVSVSSIFIIDPLYTIWLLGAVCLVSVVKTRQYRTRWSKIALLISSFYLGWTFIAKGIATRHIHVAFQDSGIDVDDLITTPAPFNTMVWRGVAKNEEGFHEIYYSISGGRAYEPQKISLDRKLLAKLENEEYYTRLDWFTHGFVTVETLKSSDLSYEDDGVERAGIRVVLRDLRMGSNPDYFFSFDVGELTPEGSFIAAEDSVKLATPRNVDGAIDALQKMLTGEDLF